MDKVFKEGKYKITPMNVSHINEVAQIEQVSFPPPGQKKLTIMNLRIMVLLIIMFV